MRRIRNKVVYSSLLFAWLTVATSYGISNGEQSKIRGLITARTGDTLVLKAAEGNIIVVLTDDTKVQKPKGLGLRKTQMSFTALIPGLKISVDGVGDDQNRVVAKKITFSGDDLQLAESIQAGLNPTQQAVEVNQQEIATNKAETAANRERIEANEKNLATTQQDIEAVSQRFSDLTEFDVKGETMVYFATGSTKIPAKHQSALMDLAHNAVNLTGYLIEVKGYADSTGNAIMNQKLSMERAQEVVAFLIQTCNVPVRRIVAPGAMGTAAPVASNETAQGRAQNRRVEVKVLVNRGLAGGE